MPWPFKKSRITPNRYLDEARYGNGRVCNVVDGAAGQTYEVEAWTLGGGRLHPVTPVEGFGDDDNVDRLGVTASDALDPGIDLDAGAFCSWSEVGEDRIGSADE